MVNDRTLLGGIAVLALAALVVTQTGVLGNLSGATGPQTGPDAPGGDDDSVASLYIKANDALASNQPSYVNVSYEVVGPNGEEITGSTDTSQGYSKISNLDENTDYTVRMYDDDGSGSDYYLTEKTVTTGEGVKRQTIQVEKEGSVSTEVFETSGATDDDDTLSVSKGATETFDIEVTENTQNAVFKQPAIVLKTNDTAAISDLEVSGSSAEQVPDRLSSYDDLFDTGTAEIVDFSKKTYTVQVTRAEDDASTATVDAAIVDLASFTNDQGVWTMGYENSDDADVGASDTTIATQTVK